MKTSRWLVTLWLTTLPAAVPAVWGQQNSPHLGYVLPAGGRQGTTFQVTARSSETWILTAT